MVELLNTATLRLDPFGGNPAQETFTQLPTEGVLSLIEHDGPDEDDVVVVVEVVVVAEVVVDVVVVVVDVVVVVVLAVVVLEEVLEVLTGPSDWTRTLSKAVLQL